MSGNNANSLVGMIQTGAGTPGIFQAQTSLLIGCINWFNRRNLALQGANFSGASTSSTCLFH